MGDSFTYGEELSDLNKAWPVVLAEKISAKVTNIGKPGSGNTRMVRKAVENVGKYDLIVIAWSHYARVEFADDRGIFDIWPGSNPVYNKELIYRNELSHYLTKNHSDVYFYQQYLINVVLLQEFLKRSDQKYVMVNSFGNNWNDFKDIEEIKTLARRIDDRYFLGWPNDQMMEWTWGCPQGPRGHFLEEGHKIVADKIYEHIRNLGWIS